MIIVGLDAKTTEFTVTYVDADEKRFPGTVAGAVEVRNLTAKESDNMPIMITSSLNHPDDYPEFEEHSIDIAANYLDDAIAAGVITVAGNDYDSFNYGI